MVVRDFHLLEQPYCKLPSSWALRADGTTKYCDFVVLGVGDGLIIRLKIALWVGVIVGAPVWLYQLWAFIAPGLHRRERRYSYAFAAVATPLFAAGFVIGFLLVSRSVPFLLGISPSYTTTVNLDGYFDFVTSVMLLFGLGVIVMFGAFAYFLFRTIKGLIAAIDSKPYV